MIDGKDQCFLMKNWFLEEYLIYFKSELMLNAKLSHLPNSLIRSHSAFTRKWSGLFEMAICVKVFGFRPNWPLHNKIMVAGFIYNIFQKHQYCQILNFSKVKPTPPSIMLQHIHWATFVNSAFFSKIFKFQTDLVMAIGQTFSGWCIKQMRQFTSKQSSSLPKKCRKIRFWDWYWKCCQRAQKDSKVVQKRFWNVVLTCKWLSFSCQTQSFNLLATILSLIFEASKCSIFGVWKQLSSDVSKIKQKWSFFALYR